MDIISKQQAREQGLTHYFTGKPCKHGHVTIRYVNSGRCVECTRLAGQRNAEQIKKASREWNRRNRDRIAAYKKEYYSDPDNKQQFLDKCSEYRNKHKEKYAAHCRNRQAVKLQRTPSWLTSEDQLQIESLYAEAQRLTTDTGIKHVVDHFYPLQGEVVSGLHHPLNLQVITEGENAAKINKHPGDFYQDPEV